MDIFKNNINENNYNILKDNNLIDILTSYTLKQGSCDLALDDYIMMLRESTITSISYSNIVDANDLSFIKYNDKTPEHSIILISKNDLIFDDDILSDIFTKTKEYAKNNSLNILYNLFDDNTLEKLKVLIIMSLLKSKMLVFTKSL